MRIFIRVPVALCKSKFPHSSLPYDHTVLTILVFTQTMLGKKIILLFTYIFYDYTYYPRIYSNRVGEKIISCLHMIILTILMFTWTMLGKISCSQRYRCWTENSLMYQIWKKKTVHELSCQWMRKPQDKTLRPQPQFGLIVELPESPESGLGKKGEVRWYCVPLVGFRGVWVSTPGLGRASIAGCVHPVNHNLSKVVVSWPPSTRMLPVRIPRNIHPSIQFTVLDNRRVYYECSLTT